MSLFQASVLKKHLNEQNKQAVTEVYVKYKSYFFNSVIQQNIRESKEEQFQEGFLRELFVNILGYTINSNPGKLKTSNPSGSRPSTTKQINRKRGM